MAIISFFAGSFKPPHAGHYDAAKYLFSPKKEDDIKDTNISVIPPDKVIIRMGSAVRDGIGPEMSTQLWNLYLSTSGKGVEQGKITIDEKGTGNPIRDVYEFVEKEAQKGDTVYVGAGPGDYDRFTPLTNPNHPKHKQYNPNNIKVREFKIPSQAGGIRATEVRKFIKDGDKVSFFNSIPNHLNPEQKGQAWDIVYSATPAQTKPIDPRAVSQQLEEDLYNPKDKVNDYMRSSEYKAGMPDGSKDDIDPSYRYKRGGIYGRMYENEKGKILHVYDFDDTIVTVSTEIPFIIQDPQGKLIDKGSLSSTEFPEKSKELEARLGSLSINYDFKDFEKQISNAILNTGVLNKLKKSLSNPQIKTTILTARSIGHPVTRYLKSIGLEAYVVPLGMQIDGKVTGQDKANWIENHIKKGYSTIYFIDDSKENRTAVLSLKSKYPDINLTVENPHKVSEMIGMMTEPEKKKHAKNMKRLNKDMSKLKGNNYGGGGYKVPDYVKGTLTRKLYEMEETKVFSKDWWKKQLNEILTEGGAAGHMAHPFDLSDVNNGKDLLDIFEKSSKSLEKQSGAVKIDGVNSSIRLVDIDGKKQFALDRGSKQALDLKGVTKDDLEDRFKTKDGTPHGFIKTGGEVLDMFNEALPTLKKDLIKLGAWEDPNILFNMEYVSGKTNVQKYDNNFIAIHGLNKIEMVDEPSKKTGRMLSVRKSKEIAYNKNDLQSLLDSLKPIAKKRGFEVYGSVPTTMTKKPNFSSALSKNYTIKTNEEDKRQSLNNWLSELNNIPKEDFIFMDGIKRGAVSKLVYTTLLKGGNIDELFENEEDKQKAIEGWTTYLATEKLGDEVLKVLDSPMGTADNHEGVVIRDKNIANIPFKITGKFILGGLQTGFR